MLGALSSGATHGYGVATLVRERSAGALEIEDAALYQALHRLERKGLVAAEWGLSDNNRRARLYELTTDGRKRRPAFRFPWQTIRGHDVRFGWAVLVFQRASRQLREEIYDGGSDLELFPGGDDFAQALRK